MLVVGNLFNKIQNNRKNMTSSLTFYSKSFDKNLKRKNSC